MRMNGAPTWYICMCQECGGEFECEEPLAKICDDCLDEAELLEDE